MAELFPPKNNGRSPIATYDYRDETGELLIQVCRYRPKDFRQRRPKPGGGWEWSVKGIRIVPYRLPELLGEPARSVAVVEGERDVDNLAEIGVLTTCNAGGAGKWTAEHAKFLHGRHVIILADNDASGKNHAQQVALSLHGIAESVRVVELPGLPDKGDVSDWIAAGGTQEELERLAEAAPEWTPTVEPWKEIDSLEVRDLPEFPTHALPDVLRTWAEAESHATQTPPDLAGLLALAVCSACISRQVVVNPRDEWREPVNLYVAVLLEPGNRKSAVFGDAIKPLRDLETALVDAKRPDVARRQSERRQAEIRLRKLEKVAAENDDAAAREQAGKVAEQLAEESEPVLPRLVVDDATSEKLGMMLSEQGGRISQATTGKSAPRIPTIRSMSRKPTILGILGALLQRAEIWNKGIWRERRSYYECARPVENAAKPRSNRSRGRRPAAGVPGGGCPGGVGRRTPPTQARDSDRADPAGVGTRHSRRPAGGL